MYLHITLKSGILATSLIPIIINSIKEGKDKANNEIKMWSIKEFDDGHVDGYIPPRKARIIHKSDQYKDLGWLELISGEGLIAVDFYPKSSNSEEDSVPQETITVLMCKFASAIRIHFGEYIDKIGLYGL